MGSSSGSCSTAWARPVLNIAHARINTEKGVALDAIYVKDKAGGKVTDKALLAELQKRLEAAVFA